MSLNFAGYSATNCCNSQFKFTSYYSSDTHTWDPRTKSVRLYMLSGGGGGGSGRKGATGTAKSGGQGGGPGTFLMIDVSRSIFGATTPITVGAGGLGGASQTTNDTNGNDGAQGGQSFVDGSTGFTTTLSQQGRGGTTTGGSLANTNTVYSNLLVAKSLIPIASISANAQVSLAYNSLGATGGGAGGGQTAADADVPPCAGTNIITGVTTGTGTEVLAGGIAAVYPANAGAGAGRDAALRNFATGGGGGYSGLSNGDGGKGGAAGIGGAGGGGGGSSVNGVGNSGAGGDGSDGLVWIFEFFSKVY